MTALAQTPHFIGKQVQRGEVMACVPRTRAIALELPLSQEEAGEARETPPPRPF